MTITTTYTEILTDPVAVVQPTSADHLITTTYAYDRAGNLTQLRDGRGNATTPASNAYDVGYSYNAWNQRDLAVQPSTTAGQTLADRKTQTVFDAGGLTVKKIEPGGVTTTNMLDELGRPFFVQADSTKFFVYDPVGHLVQADSQLYFTYDDRGLLVNADGSLGSAAYTYDADGRLTKRTDLAGDALFTWTRQSLPATAKDPLTNTKQTYNWDDDNRLKSINYATLTPTTIGTRTYSYDAADHTLTDSYADATTQRWFNNYIYDDNGNVTAKTVGPTGVTGAGTNHYDYDWADRLISYTPAGSTTATLYSYDDAGNRASAGANTFTYDARGRMTASLFLTYTWTPNGNLNVVHNVSNGANTTSTYDGFDRLVETKTVTSGGATTADTTISYDDLDRIAGRNSASFSYEGMNPDPISDGTFTATHGVAGNPIAYKTGTNARLTLTNQHGDLTGLISPSGTLASSYSYDPYGIRTGTTPPALGFQGDYTDPTTTQVDMGARWYQPNIDTFTSQDTNTGQPDNPITQNAYTYAANNPLAYTDPTGHSIDENLRAGNYHASADSQYTMPTVCWCTPGQAPNLGAAWAGGDEVARETFLKGEDPCHCSTAAEIWLRAAAAQKRGNVADQYGESLRREWAIEQTRDNTKYREVSNINVSSNAPATHPVVSLVNGQLIVEQVNNIDHGLIPSIDYSVSRCSSDTNLVGAAGARHNEGFEHISADYSDAQRLCLKYFDLADQYSDYLPKGDSIWETLKKVGILAAVVVAGTAALVLTDGAALTAFEALGATGTAEANYITEASNATEDGLPALRQAYVDDVGSISDNVAGWEKAGANPEEVAREAWADRRALGIQYKELTPPDILQQITERNIAKYGDPLGPSVDWLRAQGKTWQQIVDSATRPGGQDLGF